MCGICGIIDYRSSRIEKGLLSRASSQMYHRGPDDEGFYIDNPPSGPSVGLGHRRLKIIDLSEAGHQPMTNEDGTIWIVFNGEIYNFNELKTELEKKRHVFRSRTDTECIIHLYEEFGEECVHYLRGMFAFAIWDKKNEVLILARDRVGKKPLLYYHRNGSFCFASEFCALLKCRQIDNEINMEAIDEYLSFGYIPAPGTIYKHVFKLPPAHILVLKNDEVKIKQYWSLNYLDKIRISEQEASLEVLRLLKESIGLRLCSDVPLGAFLSGGVDSSTIVALMTQLSANKVKTFSIGFEDNDYNELQFARNISEKFGTDHHEFIVKPDALKILPLLVERYGEPYADSSCIPTYYVAQQTKQHVTVALNGDGGDELFAGYDRYQAMLLTARMPIPVRKLLSLLSVVLPDSTNPKHKLRRLKRFLNAAALPLQDRYLKWIGIFDSTLKKKIYANDLLKQIADSRALDFIKTFMPMVKKNFTIDALLAADTLTYLPYDLLVKVDITSMANSLEARSPFLDQKLMEFAARLPVEYKMRNFVKKYILKKAVTGILPKENIVRKKMGFGMPVGNWFRGNMKEFLIETILSKRSCNRNYFNMSVISGMLQDHVKNKADYSLQLWSLLMLEMWHQRFID
ncbi:MAG: asparagine synthase (glutamine-hydrolyzing) [Omnitrophica WOR_2 bacterium GWF2_43_52]|nr:MAG: asparagine synthase (glutamine-hydrolyzing) [Omnitrophica WOR_2 bacterium GWF2_43_52]OGX57641.1 MAG: asparagine synthase (glutamine-hydrolyzing) [Omnitrophica WOR_2 bacterium RIFOXYC2_FULL_43_9]